MVAAVAGPLFVTVTVTELFLACVTEIGGQAMLSVPTCACSGTLTGLSQPSPLICRVAVKLVAEPLAGAANSTTTLRSWPTTPDPPTCCNPGVTPPPPDTPPPAIPGTCCTGCETPTAPVPVELTWD